MNARDWVAVAIAVVVAVATGGLLVALGALMRTMTALQLTIDDIKLAGSFEPWRGPDAQDIRFLKDIYPPSMNLHYR